MKSIRVQAGDKFNRWTVIQELKGTKKHRVFRCRCDCGTVKAVHFQSLRFSKSKSCGCFQKELAIKHGGWKSTEYTIWAHMKYRCSKTKTRQRTWYRYGGRGIKVCQRWAKSFQYFLQDMGPRPSSEHSLERINNDGDYEPKNCRWATRKEQGQNKRRSVFERVVMLLAKRAGKDDAWVNASITDGMSDSDLARHIARCWHP